MKDWLEYGFVWAALKFLGILPRGMSRIVAVGAGRLLFLFLLRFRRVALFNLRLAFPERTSSQRRRILATLVRNLAWMGAEFAHFPRWTRENIEEIVVLDGHENFLTGRAGGKGVIFLTGHMGAWEVSSFAHALYGFPLHFVARQLDNRRVDALINEYRCLSGNSPIFKNESARAVLRVLQECGTIGILADQNTVGDEGVFIDFLGTPACTTTGIARVALHTGAAVVPGYAWWDEDLRKYCLRFEPPVELVHTGNTDADVRANTERFTRIIEKFVRAHPDQWLWVHARWKTRPDGEKPLYSF